MSTSPSPTDIENEYDEEEDEEPIEQLIQMADEARKRFTDAERQLRDIEFEMKDLNKSLDKDYGLTTCLQRELKRVHERAQEMRALEREFKRKS